MLLVVMLMVLVLLVVALLGVLKVTLAAADGDDAGKAT